MSVDLYEVHRIPIPGLKRAVATREVLLGTYENEAAAFEQVATLQAARASETRAQRLARSIHPLIYRVRQSGTDASAETVPPSKASVSRKRA